MAGPPTISSAEIEARVRRRADMENSDFIGSAELTQYCEKAFQEFYGIVTTAEPDLVVKTQSVTLSAGDGAKSLATDYKALRLIRHNASYSLRRVELQSRETLEIGGRRGKPTHYWLSGLFTGANTFTPLPVPDATYAVTVYYIPNIKLEDVTGGGLNFLAGWDEYVVLTGAIKCKDKEESDVSVLLAERKLLLDHIIAQISVPDTGEPPRIAAFGAMPLGLDPFDYEERFGL